jgi:hypothetical protein
MIGARSEGFIWAEWDKNNWEIKKDPEKNWPPVNK